MADPLSVAGLAAGLVSLGIQVTGGLVSYVGAIRGRPEDLASANGYINSIQAAIDHISSSSSCAQASQTASDSIKVSVGACKAELKALEELVVKLSTPQHGNPTLRGKIRDGSKKLTYAFHRPDIKELEDRLSRAYTTIQGAMQALGLDLQYSMNEALAAVRTDTEQTRTNVQTLASDLLVARSDTIAMATHVHEIKAAMPVIASDVARIGPTAIEHMDKWGVHLSEKVLATSSSLSRLGVASERSIEHNAERFDRMEKLIQSHSQRLEDLVLGSAGNARTHLMDQGANIVANTVATRLISRPSSLRAIVDDIEHRGNAHPGGTLSIQTDSTTHLSTTNCMKPLRERPGACHCRRRRVRQRTQKRWGPILAFDESETVELHHPDCMFSHFAEGGRNRQLGLAYIGKVARWAIAYTFSTSSGAGGYSIGPSFTYHPTVDGRTAPAFQLMKTVHFSLFHLRGNAQAGTEMINLCGPRILQLFQARRAHPLDVDVDNRSLMHLLTNIVDSIISWSTEPSMASGATDLLGMLLDSGVPGNSHNVWGVSPVFAFVNMMSTVEMGQPVPKELITKLCGMLLSSTPDALSVADEFEGPSKYTFSDGFRCVLDLLASLPEVAEAFECGPLSLAVLARDEQRVASILTAAPHAMCETNLLRLKPLHLAVDKPACLRLLLRESTRAQLSERWRSYSLVELAMMTCSAKCKTQKVDSYPGGSCRSIEGVLILLEDERSSLTINPSNYTARYCKHAVDEYAKQLKCRRERLKQKALKHLAQQQILDLGLNSSAVLDVDAEVVASMIRDKGLISFPEIYGVSGHARYRSSVYHRIRDVQTATIFHSMGFLDVSAPDSNGITPLIFCMHWYDNSECLLWFLEHGVDIFSRLQRPTSSTDHDHGCSVESPAQDTTGAHHLAFWVGDELRMDCIGPQFGPSDFARIVPFSLAAVTVDRCHCGCSIHGCSPLTVLFRQMTSATSEPTRLLESIQRCLELSWEYIDTNLVSAAIRMITFQALGLTHICCKIKYLNSREHPCSVLVAGCPDEEADEVREFESEDLGLLEVLVADFEGRLAELSTDGPLTVEVSVNFFRVCWMERMKEELEKKRQGRTWEEERQETAHMGVDWDAESEPKLKPDLKSLDFWVAQVDRIMAGEPKNW